MAEAIPLDIEKIRSIIELLFKKLGEILKTVNIEGIGETFKQIPSLRDNMISWVLEGIKPGSPEWKEDAEGGFMGLINEWTRTVTEDILGLELPAAPFKPEDAVVVAKKYMQLNLAFQSIVTIVSLIVEVASLGQVDTLHEIASKIDYALGLSRVASALHEAKFYPALITPIQQHWNAQFQSAIPGSSDLIDFVVKEAFPLEELPEAPEQFAEYMKYQNFSPLWSKAYWHAHWRLVSVGDLYDLFHRKEITADELTKQLIFHDYRPEWTDKLLELSYSLIPRVDLRRAWELGAIDTIELERRMGLIGYSPADAALETDIQIRVALSAEISALRKEVERDFLDGFILEETAKADMLALGLHPDVVEALMAALKIKYDRSRRRERVDNYTDAYLKDMITLDDLDARLHEELVNEEVIQNILEDEYIKKYKKPKAD